jgi:hypothetical protein
VLAAVEHDDPAPLGEDDRRRVERFEAERIDQGGHRRPGREPGEQADRDGVAGAVQTVRRQLGRQT